jgi:hypothetical protein
VRYHFTSYLSRLPVSLFTLSLCICVSFLPLLSYSLYRCLHLHLSFLTVCRLLSISQSQSYVKTDGQSVSLSWNKTPIWGLRQDFYYRQTVADLLIWGALSDKRTGLLFLFRRLLRLAGLRWKYSTPPPHGSVSVCQSAIPLRESFAD